MGSLGETVSLREAMDGLLQESFVRPRPGDASDRSVPLALDVEERGDVFVVTAPIPGINPEDVELSVLGDTVRIRASAKTTVLRRARTKAGCCSSGATVPSSGH